MKVLGLDIGGANIKASDADGNTQSVAFPMWTRKDDLTEILATLAPNGSAPDMIALTMTAELADCFQMKSEGVEFVINAVETAFPEIPVRVWLTSGEFAEPDDARDLPMLVAAANWHALATWAGRAVPEGAALLVDIGSTTTDIIPLLNGLPVSKGRNDSERLMSGELVYTGASRTPICAIVSAVPLHDAACPIAAELFATIADALVVLGLLQEDINRTDTADNRPLTMEYCRQRLARMLCCDVSELSEQELVDIAAFVVGEQQNQIHASLAQVVERLDGLLKQAAGRSLQTERLTVLLSGSGVNSGRRIIDLWDGSPPHDVLELPQMFYRSVSDSACAFAVARLAHDRCRDDLLELHTSAIWGT